MEGVGEDTMKQLPGLGSDPMSWLGLRERNFLLKTLSPVVLPGEPGAGVTGKERHHWPHQVEGKIEWGDGTCRLCQSPRVTVAAITWHSAVGGWLASGPTGTLFPIGLPRSKPDLITIQVKDAWFKVSQSIISGPASWMVPRDKLAPPEPQRLAT